MTTGALEDYRRLVSRIAEGPVASAADSVDREARFPSESFDALREAKLLAAYVPVELGGLGVSTSDLAATCFELGRRCASTGMIFAMHQIQVAAIQRHAESSSWFRDYLTRLADEQRLIASATSEIGTGGDLNRSIAGLHAGGSDDVTFEKQAPVISYGEYADDLLTTVRRSIDAEESDQVLVLSMADQHCLDRIGCWDTLGMRGTCSPGFSVSARVASAQVLAAPFSVIGAETMVPFSHLLWAEVWLGIATSAFDRTRSFFRQRARGSGNGVPVGADRLSELMTDLSMLRAEVRSVLDLFEEADAEPGRQRLSTMSFAVRINNLKIASSETAARICLDALSAIGIAGFRNDSPYSVGRQVRDILSAPLMVSNDRIHATNANLLLIAKEV